MGISHYTENANALANRFDSDPHEKAERDLALAQMETALAAHRIADALERLVTEAGRWSRNPFTS